MTENEKKFNQLCKDLQSLEEDDPNLIEKTKELFADNISVTTTAHVDKHANKSDSQILNDLLIKKYDKYTGKIKHDANGHAICKVINGIYDSEDKQWLCINMLMTASTYKTYAKSIYGQLNAIKPRENIAINSDRMQLGFDNDEDNIIGHGFINIDNFYHKYQTDKCTTLVLKKDDNQKYGFKIQTAFPGIAYDNISSIKDYAKQQYKNIEINDTDDCTDIMLQTDIYKSSTAHKQEYLRFHANPKNQKLSYDSFYDDITDDLIYYVKNPKANIDFIKIKDTYIKAGPLKRIYLEEKAKHPNIALRYNQKTDTIVYDMPVYQNKSLPEYKVYINNNQIDTKFYNAEHEMAESPLAMQLGIHNSRVSIISPIVQKEIMDKKLPIGFNPGYKYVIELQKKCKNAYIQEKNRQINRQEKCNALKPVNDNTRTIHDAPMDIMPMQEDYNIL